MGSNFDPDVVKNYVKDFLPEFEGEILDYVAGILLDDSETFGTAEDLNEAVGPIIQSYATNLDDPQVEEICTKFFNKFFRKQLGSSEHKKLDAPVHLASVVEEMSFQNKEEKTIWMTKAERESQVDKGKLDKAEARRKTKLDQKDAGNGELLPSEVLMEEATVSQQMNKRTERKDASGNAKSYDIAIEGFDISYSNKTLIKDATVSLIFGRRYGFVGRNGLGKTTFLRALSSGQLKIQSHLTVLHVEQEVTGDDTSAIESVLECDTARSQALKREKELNQLISSAGEVSESASAELSEVHEALNDMEADKAPARAGAILNGLGFSAEGQQRPTREYSGGWRMRLALARALFSKPDLLLLDEPTNMLDMKAIIWLETYLQSWTTTLLVVSHDRQFLNTICTDILHIHSQRLETYRGNYDVFAKSRDERLNNQRREYEAQQELRAHTQAFIDKFRYNAHRAALVQSRIKMLEKLPELKPVEKESIVVLKFPVVDKLSPPILQLDEMSFRYSDTDPWVLRKVCVNAPMDSRICVVGDNGAGKTTLLKILMGQLSPSDGVRHAHRSLRIGYFAQHHVDAMDVRLCPLEVMAQTVPGKGNELYRSMLGSFGVSGELATQKIALLSGGQKSRVAFALMCATSPNFLVLDEPTNHLDMETIEALGEAINKFEGGVVLVSHDERLIRAVCKELWLCKQGTVTTIEGGFDAYRKTVEKEFQM